MDYVLSPDERLLLADFLDPWLPIAEAPAGNDTDGPFFDVAWAGETTRDGTPRRVMDCYRDGNTVKVCHGYPAVWTVFNPQPTHFRATPRPPAAEHA